MGSVEDIYCHMISALSKGEKVKILVDDDAMAEKVIKRTRRAGADMSNVIPMKIKSADVWIRDYGPTFLLDEKKMHKALVKWNFNAWGAKYDDLLYDDISGEEVAKASSVPIYRPGIVLEGGSIDVNGSGVVLTTEQCLLNKNRNPSLSKEQIEGYLQEYINVSKVIWLISGIEGDDTDGHVDDFARFVGDDRIVCAYSSDRSAHNREVLERNLKVLEDATDIDGNGFEVTKLPMPGPLRIDEEDRWLPASYANFYIGNDVVLLPVFKDRNDAKAISMLEDCFPDRDVVPIQAIDLVYGYGGIHCITQQEPSTMG